MGEESAEALEDCEISIIPKEDFKVLIDSSLNVGQKFIQLLAKNVSEKEEQLLSLAYDSLRKRIADALLQLKLKYKTSQDEKFIIHLSRADLANIAGTATESLIRTLSDFKAEGLISIKDGDITILDPTRLASMIN